MNKSNLFKLAHIVTKATIKAGDNYQATFGQAMKMIVAITPKQAMSVKQATWLNDLISSTAEGVKQAVESILSELKYLTQINAENVEVAQQVLAEMTVKAVTLVAKKSMQSYFDVAKEFGNTHLYRQMLKLVPQNYRNALAKRLK